VAWPRLAEPRKPAHRKRHTYIFEFVEHRSQGKASNPIYRLRRTAVCRVSNTVARLFQPNLAIILLDNSVTLAGALF
jgi:hypothetical protein